MTFLGIDYGRAHVGVAVASRDTNMALPLTTLHKLDRGELFNELRQLVAAHEVTRVVVGVPVTWPENRALPGMREEAEAFARALGSALGLPVELVDERLTSKAAAELAGGPADEHALAAMLILQSYLDRPARPV